MYQPRTPNAKADPVARWALPDRVFFACGACHILTYAFLKRYPSAGFNPLWIRPKGRFAGNHIIAVRGEMAFDYHGFTVLPTLLNHTVGRARQRWSGWDADLVALPIDVLVSESLSKTYPGLWLREPGQFLFDALARANKFLMRYPPPSAES
ncbi:MAG: hypothetical protein K0U93_12125 [Gammaproteobacteria bacterium]|nr:hypothetical protein [Gammaproteobacteria bacterium]